MAGTISADSESQANITARQPFRQLAHRIKDFTDRYVEILTPTTEGDEMRAPRRSHGRPPHRRTAALLRQWRRYWHGASHRSRQRQIHRSETNSQPREPESQWSQAGQSSRKKGAQAGPAARRPTPQPLTHWQRKSRRTNPATTQSKAKAVGLSVSASQTRWAPSPNRRGRRSSDA